VDLYNYKLTIAYDGTHYHGWQIQPNGVSIQEVIEKALKTIFQKEIRIMGSGRTDAGVHAHGQVAHFKIDQDIDLKRVLGSLNGLLPKDIRILKIEKVESDFHAQYSAQGKIYHYHLCFARVQSPFTRCYALHVKEKIDLEKMAEAAKLFLGVHDFYAFANEAHTGCAAYDSVRHLQRLDIVPEEGGVRLEFEADGFLYKMVRNIVGTLLEIATGKKEIDDIPKIFASRDRRLAGKAAAPQGLFLIQVKY
jgi:tRNA pseudouridine38-40 synthase